MAEPSDVLVRRPAVAGYFYPADSQQCRVLAQQLIERARRANEGAGLSPGKWIGGLVPHAGWICSGEIAAQTLVALAAAGPVDLVVVFGAVHSAMELDVAALDSHQQWVVPNGQPEIAQSLRRRLLEQPGLFIVDDRFHEQEHAVEVELPLIAQLWPEATLLPVEVPLGDDAAEIGRHTARQVQSQNLRAMYLASSDLTHYGPAYGFAPAGVGTAGLDWAMQNDQRLLDRVLQLDVEQIRQEVASSHNACGGGAIMAMLAACRESGATTARLLRHANSYQMLASVAPQRPDNAVGYAAAVVGCPQSTPDDAETHHPAQPPSPKM